MIQSSIFLKILFIKKYDEIKKDDSLMAELFDSADVKDEGMSLN